MGEGLGRIHAPMSDGMSYSGLTALPASLELSPRGVVKDPAALVQIPEATRVYLVDAGDTPAALWAEACLTLARAGLRPVPHIACRRIRSLEEIDDRLE